MHSRSSAPARPSISGFSLIELLVVIFIIGLMVGAVSLSVNIGGEPEDQLEEEAQRLLELSRLAEDRSVLTGEPIGLLFTPPHSSPEAGSTWAYEWQRYRGGQWVAAEVPLDSWQLSESMELSLEVEGTDVNFARVRGDDETPPLPSIVFYPGGEVTPFLLTLFDGEAIDEQRLLTSQRTGQVETIDADEAHAVSRGVVERRVGK